MRIRDLLTSGVSIAVVVIHFAVQWYGWKLHIGETADPTVLPPGDMLWRVCSFPLFAVIPRRVHYLYFLEILVANSAVWGVAAAWCAHVILRRVFFGMRAQRGRPRPSRGTATLKSVAAPQTRADRLVELKHLRDQGLVTQEEYRRRRDVILNQA